MLDRAVHIEMLVTEIREHGAIDRDTVNAVLRQVDRHIAERTRALGEADPKRTLVQNAGSGPGSALTWMPFSAHEHSPSASGAPVSQSTRFAAVT